MIVFPFCLLDSWKGIVFWSWEMWGVDCLLPSERRHYLGCLSPGLALGLLGVQPRHYFTRHGRNLLL